MLSSLLANVLGELLGWSQAQRGEFYSRSIPLGITDYGGIIALAREVDNEGL